MNPATSDWIITPVSADLVRGAIELEPTALGVRPHRLPGWVRAQLPDPQLLSMEAQPSGVRLVLRTAATVVELDVVPTTVVYRNAPPRPAGVYDLLVDGRLVGRSAATGGHVMIIDLETGAIETRPGPVGTVAFTDLPARRKDLEIWLPYNETTELVAIRTDAPVEPVPAGDRRRWLHHGSSISHGSNAASASATWPAVAASAGDVELTNLGLGGSALLDAPVARAMRDLPADLISVKMGINLVNTDLMRMRAFTAATHGFLDTLRDGHPTVPILVISPILCPIHEDTPGPSVMDLSDAMVQFHAGGDPAESVTGKLTLASIRTELVRIVAQRSATDPHLHYLDGRELYGPADVDELPLPDQLHPDAGTHQRMGERFAALAFEPGGPFAA